MTKRLLVAVSIRRLPSTSHWHRQLNSRRSRRIMDGLLQLLLDLLLVSWRNARMLVTGLRIRMSSGDYGKGEFSDVTISLKKASNVKTPHPMPSESELCTQDLEQPRRGKISPKYGVRPGKADLCATLVSHHSTSCLLPIVSTHSGFFHTFEFGLAFFYMHSINARDNQHTGKRQRNFL